MGWDLALMAAVVIAFAFVSRRTEGTIVTSAIVFVTAGLLLGSEGVGLFVVDIGSGAIRHLAEVTLALVLFTDASSLNTRRLSKESAIPVRLLGIGLPLTIVLGGLIAVVMFPELVVFEAIVIAILLAPTDAALGQAVVSDERLPSRLRQGLNVESGLNDGVCVPLLFAAIALAQLEEAPGPTGEVLVDLVTELAVATIAGLVVGGVVALLWKFSKRRQWLSGHWAQIVPLATAAIAYTATVELGGSGFIGAFVAGLAFGHLLRAEAHESSRLMEETGSLLSAATFFVFGAVVVGPALVGFEPIAIVYAVLSLTVIRMIPVAIALIGLGTSRPTVAFAGWFGPRGLASIVFMLTVVEEANLEGTRLIVQVTTLTVLLSVFAHGITAPGLTNRYTAWYEGSQERRALEGSER